MTTAPSQMTQQVTQQLVDLLAPPASVTKLTQASRLLAKWRTILLENTLVQKDGENVQSGPFKGMVYTGVTATEYSRLPRLIGYYERTLRPVIDEIISRGYPLVIDVGCAEGYYAVGLATQMPQTRV